MNILGSSLVDDKTPLVSILIPTRGRVQKLLHAVDSCWSLACEKKLLEFVFKVDDDDQETLAIVEKLNAIVPYKCLVTPRGRGYGDLHEWISMMAKLSSGVWILLFSDDAKMTTQGWDQQLALHPMFEDGINLLIPKVVQRSPTNEFLFLSRTVFDVLGWMGPSPHVDTWLATIMMMLDRAFYSSSIIIDHPNEDRDLTAVDREKVTAQSSIALRDTDMVRLKVRDAVSLLDYMDRVSTARVSTAQVPASHKILMSMMTGSNCIEKSSKESKASRGRTKVNHPPVSTRRKARTRIARPIGEDE